MPVTLHLTSGDSAGDSLRKSGVPGDLLVWHDLLYDGPRNPGWPTAATLAARTAYLVQTTGGGLTDAVVSGALHTQYDRLAALTPADTVVLWFDACLFDLAMLVHVLTCLQARGHTRTELLVVDAWPGITPYHGLGQLTPAQLAEAYPRRQPVTTAQVAYAVTADRAFAERDVTVMQTLAAQAADHAPLPWLPAAARRWLQELPDPVSGLGQLHQLALAAVRAGHATPGALFAAVAAADTAPQYWGDTTLWATLNALADRTPPLVHITGPLPRLPQWPGLADLARFRVTPAG